MNWMCACPCVCVCISIFLFHYFAIPCFFWWHCVDRHEKYACSEWHVPNLLDLFTWKVHSRKFFESITQWMERGLELFALLSMLNNMWRGYKIKTKAEHKMNRIDAGEKGNRNLTFLGSNKMTQNKTIIQNYLFMRTKCVWVCGWPHKIISISHSNEKLKSTYTH